MEPLRLDQLARFTVLKLLLRPVARFCVRHSLLLQECQAALRIELVEAARDEIIKGGGKPTASRINVMTGVYREEVPRILRERDEPPTDVPDLLVRVLGQWEHDPDFCRAQGGPKVLSYRGISSEFYALVGKVNRNINPTSVLYALERNGAVEVTPRGLRMRKGGASVNFDPKEGFSLISKDMDSLLQLAEVNIGGEDPIGHHHIRTEYDNIPPQYVEQIKAWLLEQGRLFHKRARHYLAKWDRDINPRLKSDTRPGCRVVLQSFSLAAEPPTELPKSRTKTARSPQKGKSLKERTN